MGRIIQKRCANCDRFALAPCSHSDGVCFYHFDESLDAYLRKSAEKLAKNRFACIVIGDVRDNRGFYRNLPGKTVEIMERAECRYYNESILVTPAGSLPIRITRQFNAGRKVGKTHQNVLVFCKGDPKRATSRLGDVYIPPVEEDQ